MAMRCDKSVLGLKAEVASSHVAAKVSMQARSQRTAGLAVYWFGGALPLA